MSEKKLYLKTIFFSKTKAKNIDLKMPVQDINEVITPRKEMKKIIEKLNLKFPTLLIYEYVDLILRLNSRHFQSSKHLI